MDGSVKAGCTVGIDVAAGSDDNTSGHRVDPIPARAAVEHTTLTRVMGHRTGLQASVGLTEERTDTAQPRSKAAFNFVHPQSTQTHVAKSGHSYAPAVDGPRPGVLRPLSSSRCRTLGERPRALASPSNQK